MKKLIVLMALLSSSTIIAQEFGCLGFPSAQNFSCIYQSSFGPTQLEIDFPAGHGCNQRPESGMIVLTDSSREIKVFNPSVIYTSETVEGSQTPVLKRNITYKLNPNDSDSKTISCQ